ncbi:MAG: glyoxalase [Leptolyngbyaceae cyanobacterium SL_1_1]|nr:glyoxalase [Leptolyngbyaceae cyanobacterium SL_1_1]
MTDNAKNAIAPALTCQFATIIPTLRYRDAAAAVEWLGQAFGFEKHLVVPGSDGTITHAQLVFGNGMIMVGTAHKDEFGRLQQPPSQVDAVVTQSPYILVEDVDQHYQRAIAAGAKIVLEIQDQDYGGRDYSCRDPEGHVWIFGNYNPWNTDQ